MPGFFVVNKRTAAEEGALLLLAPLYKINQQYLKKTHTQHNKSLARSSCCRPASLCVQVHGAWITGQRDLVHNFFYCIPFMKLHVEMTWGYSKPFQNENFFFSFLLLFPPSSYLNMTDGVVLSDNLLVWWWLVGMLSLNKN